MGKIIDGINASISRQQPFFSLEFFPPKTEEGKENLLLRIEKMSGLHPLFVDITWAAGGSSKDLTMSITEYTQKYLGVNALMHLSCSGVTIEDIKLILLEAKAAGIQNILALRGDPAKGKILWEPVAGGLLHAADLVKLIREEHGDYFCIGVAGFPEGHPHCPDAKEVQISHLRCKIEAGADFILTQFFYETSVFVDFAKACRAAGITCPIIPGMMPIQNYASFQRMSSYCRTHVSQNILDEMLPFRDDDDAVKEYGVKLCVQMCRELMDIGIEGVATGYHFYTMNLEKSVSLILKELGFESQLTTRKSLPWRASRSDLRGLQEDVRPINWANRPKSYLSRTSSWDEYPNGRWGDRRSPAFGELSNYHFFHPSIGSVEDRLAMWVCTYVRSYI